VDWSCGEVPQGVCVEGPEDGLELEDLENHAQVQQEDGEGGGSDVRPILPVDVAPDEPAHRVDESDSDVDLQEVKDQEQLTIQ
jgi:hypothetical protein